MARVTIERAIKRVGNRFELTLATALRARELSKGHLAKITCQNKSVVTALREIESGKVGAEILRKLRG